MIRNREYVEKVLKEGEKILLERPELAEMSLHDMLNEVDDGTEQMIHNRWGVAAWLIIRSLKSFEPKMLVESLSEVDSGFLTYEYAGYLLQSKYKVSMLELILEAEEYGAFDNIIPYVRTNIIYEEHFCEQYITKILDMMGNHKEYDSYSSFLMHYAKHIVDMGAQKLAEDLLWDLDAPVYYDFMRIMRWEWYKKDEAEASEVIGRMLGHGNIWNKKVAIDFFEVSLDYSKEAFRQYFFQMESLVLESEELLEMLVPAFVKYMIVFRHETNTELEPIYKRVFEHLEKIPESSINIKSSFIQAIQWTEDIPDKLKEIFIMTIRYSFDRNPHILDMLDSIFYRQLSKGDWKETVHVMFEVFRANKYSSDYRDFFDIMNSVNSELLKYAEEVTVEALNYMLFGELNQFFFGIGLLYEFGDFKRLRNRIDNSSFDFALTFNDKQMIRLMEGALYYIVDSKRICDMAFQLLSFSGESNETYMEFCKMDVYGNYSATMNEVSQNYKTATNKKQVYLAETVLKMHEQLSNERKLSYEIRDLQISREHQYIYRRAVQEQNRIINKMANKKSILGQLFKSSTMKYGIRNAYISFGRKDKKNYQVNDYMHHEHSMEIPAVYVKDPVSYELKKRTFLKEIMYNEASNKGLSYPTERKR